MSLDPVLQAIIDTAIDNALPDVKPASVQQTAVVAMCKHLRPYIEASMSARAPRHVASLADMRHRRWLVSVEWLDVQTSEVIAASEGRRQSGDDFYYGGELVTGLAGAADLLADYATQLGAPADDYSRAALLKSLENLRPTLSRCGGKAKMSKVSACGKWWLRADIFREDVKPER